MSKHKEFESYRTLVIAWAESRGIFEQSTPGKQNEKTREELRELRDALMAYDRPKIKDAIGDTIVTLIINWEMQVRSASSAAGSDAQALKFTGSMFSENVTVRCEMFLQGVRDRSCTPSIAEDIDNENHRRLSYIRRVMPDAEILAADLDSLLKSDNQDAPDKIAFSMRHIVTCCWLASIAFNWHLTDCIAAAWEEIRNRKGKMIDGIFVKESDL